MAKADAEQVNFFCQRCYQPVELDVTFGGFTSESLRALAATPPTEQEGSGEKREFPMDENASKRTITRMRATATYGSEFNRLTEPDQIRMGDLSYKIKIAAHLFDIVTGHGDFDHPLCQECAEDVCKKLADSVEKAEEENIHYRSYLEQPLDKGDETSSDELSEELEKLLKEENELKQHIASVEKERQEVSKAMEAEQRELQHLEDQEKTYLERFSMYQYRKNELSEQQQSVDNQLRHAQAQLEKLQKENIFNMTFHIWHRHKGHFASINGLRLGRLPAVPVEWSEINAAWGQCLLLLQSLANKLNFKFEKYKLIPLGNQSYIEVLGEKKKELPLFGSGGLKFLWNTKFDQAMVAFLDCLQQFKTHIESVGNGFEMPYRIEKDKIGGEKGKKDKGGDGPEGEFYSIKMTLNSEEHWTKALKFVLTNLKWALAFVASNKYETEQA